MGFRSLERLKLQYHKPLSTFDFKFQLAPINGGEPEGAGGRGLHSFTS